MGLRRHPTDAFRDRTPSSEVDPRATFPNTLRLPAREEAARGVAIAYATTNFAVYRAIIERLGPTERFRMETQFGVFEISRREFETTFAAIAATPSYRTGAPSMPGRCYYVQGPPPAGSAVFLVDAR
jgi:hypothetical protein